MRLLSWNIQWGCGCDGRVSFPRIVDVIRRMGDFDVVCLQEVAVNHPGLAGSAGGQFDVIAADQVSLDGTLMVTAVNGYVPSGTQFTVMTYGSKTGSFTARVLIYGDAYAGTWGDASHGGKLFGKIVRNTAAAK